MAQSVPKGADEFSPNEHHDKVCEPLNEDSDDAKQATSKDYLAKTTTKVPTVVAAFNTC
jgi:hypothetical protein